MPRGKFVNHKGRSRHFTAPEELEQESDDSEETGSGESDDESGATGGASGSKGAASKQSHQKNKKAANLSSSEEDSDEDDDDDSEAEARGSKKGVASLIEIENPNRVIKKTTQKVTHLSIEDEPELTRREREQIEKEKARLRYKKLHAAGKTTEAKSDLARLALIRQQREEAAAKREAEKKAADSKKPAGKA